MAKILISGGNGMLGRALTAELLHKGHRVSWLCRNPVQEKNVQVFLWDPSKKCIDLKAFETLDHLINLSGSNIAEKPWNKKNKEEIYTSRINSTEFLLETMQKHNITLKSICGASAIGYYGNGCEDECCDETRPAGNDFLALVCKDWEATYEKFLLGQTRLVILRIGIVLSKQGGMYAKLRPWMKAGLAAVIGSGKNYISWIHIQDLVDLFVFAVENSNMKGSYNATASEPLRLSGFTLSMAKSLKRKVLLPNVPSFFLRLLMGERASLIDKGCRVKNDRIRSAGFAFKYPELSSALHDLALQKIQRTS